jgi:hypothetical protein
MLSIIMLRVVMKNVENKAFVISVVMLSVIMLSVVAPFTLHACVSRRMLKTFEFRGMYYKTFYGRNGCRIVIS